VLAHAAGELEERLLGIALLLVARTRRRRRLAGRSAAERRDGARFLATAARDQPERPSAARAATVPATFLISLLPS
jgi:hypothetical protein